MYLLIYRTYTTIYIVIHTFIPCNLYIINITFIPYTIYNLYRTIFYYRNIVLVPRFPSGGVYAPR